MIFWFIAQSKYSKLQRLIRWFKSFKFLNQKVYRQWQVCNFNTFQHFANIGESVIDKILRVQLSLLMSNLLIYFVLPDLQCGTNYISSVEVKVPESRRRCVKKKKSLKKKCWSWSAMKWTGFSLQKGEKY